MQIFAVVRSKSGAPVSPLAERCERAAAIVTRSYRDVTRAIGEVDDNTIVIGASNRPGDAIHSSIANRLSQPMMLGYGNPNLSDAVAAFAKDNVQSAVEKLNRSSGMFACALRDTNGGRLLFYHSLTRQIPIYIAETDDVLACGNSALLLGLLIRPDLRPVYDRLGLAAFINSNNIFLDRTLFAGVRLMDTNKYAIMSDKTVTTAECDSTIDLVAKNDVSDERGHFDRLAEIYKAATRAAAGQQHAILMGLSGGKDSRLVLSGALSSGLKVRSSTNQRFSDEADDNDVLIARKIAAAYGIAHRVEGANALGSEELATRFSPRDLAVRTILLRDGMPAKLPRHPNHTSAMPIEAPSSTNVTFSGLGGELLRGGFASLDLNWLRNKPHLLNEAPALLRRKLTSRVAYFSPDLGKELTDAVNSSIDRHAARTNNAGLLELYYLFYNIGRGGIASYREAAARQELGMPCCDNRLLREGFANGQDLRLDERVHQEIMNRLQPGLSSIELAEYRWGRGANRSTIEIPAVATETARQHYPIYLQLTGGLLEELRDTILTSGTLGDVIEKTALTEIFQPVRINEPGRAVLAWTLYYAALLTNNSWCQEMPPREVVVDHGRPWFNILRDYRLELTRELGSISRADAVQYCTQAEAASARVCTKLAERFDSHDFFPEVAARNFGLLEEFSQSAEAAATGQEQPRRLANVANWARRIVLAAPAPKGPKPDLKGVREKLIAQAEVVLRERQLRLDPPRREHKITEYDLVE